MTQQDAVDQLRALTPHFGDAPEVIHNEADWILLVYLRANGAEEVADAWEKLDWEVGFQYA